MFDRVVTFICRQSLKRPLLWLLTALVLSIPAILEFPRVGLDTDLIRLLPERSRASILKQKMDELITGSGGFFAVLLESPDKDKLNKAYRDTLARLAGVEASGTLEYRHPAEFYQQFRYILVSSEFLERILDFFIRLEARVNPMGVDLLDDESENPDQGEEKEKKDKEEIKKMMRYLDLPDFHQSEDGQVMAVKVFPSRGITSLGKTKKLFQRLDTLTREIAREYGIWGGVGGSLRNSIDQYDFIIADLTRSGTITLVTVLLALAIGFGTFRILPVVLLPLALGLVWTMGSIPFLVGDLNTITSFLLLVSFGLGVDFSIHLVKRYQLEVKQKPAGDALAETFRSTGKSLVISALTTALVLFVLAFSNFRGFSEFGIVGGFSLLLILLAMLLFLPAIIVLGERLGLLRETRKPRRVRSYVPGPRLTVFLLLVILASLVVGGRGLTFNYDFSKMDVNAPREQEIKERFYRVYESVRSPGALFVARGLTSLDELVRRLQASKADETSSRIQRFHSIRELCPDNNEFRERLRLIAEIKEIIKGRWADRVEDRDYKKWMEDLRVWTPPHHPATINQLPEEIKERFVSTLHPNYFIVPVYIKGDKQKGKNAMAFAAELYNLEISPPAEVIGPFGETTVLADVLHIVTSEGPWLVLAAFLAIFLLIWLPHRSFSQALWTVLPLFTGMVLTAGIMVAAGGTLNFFNVVVFPTLIGMGVDDGVHFYRRWRERDKDTVSTQKELFGPLTLTTLTTIFGYLGIVFSRHPGLHSIGVLACLGLLCTWFTSLFLLPGLLKFRRSGRLF